MKSIDVDAEIRKNKINIDDRTDFAERLEEIESKVDTETYDPLENERELQEMIINNDNIKSLSN